jgi:V8-like Glu-specific endopeptidase
MESTAELISVVRRLAPDPERLERLLAEDPETILDRAFPVDQAILRARGILGPAPEPEETEWLRDVTRPIAYQFSLAPEPEETESLCALIERGRRRMIEGAQHGLRKLNREGESAQLEPFEIASTEAVIRAVARPAILIQAGRFFDPPPGWEILEDMRESIERTFRSVGKIELAGHPDRVWCGTGFLVAADVVMTNSHVAKYFCERGPKADWRFKPGIRARIDYIEEFSTPASAEFVLEDVIGVHERLDLALLRVSPQSPQGAPPPMPLRLASEPPPEIEKRNVYVVGYPTWDPFNNDPEIMRHLFNGIYGVKYFQPGQVMEMVGSELDHDCSTLSGNSGSPVIDLTTKLVLGLHIGPRRSEEVCTSKKLSENALSDPGNLGKQGGCDRSRIVSNKAVALWLLRNDPLVEQSGVFFD